MCVVVLWATAVALSDNNLTAPITVERCAGHRRCAARPKVETIIDGAPTSRLSGDEVGVSSGWVYRGGKHTDIEVPSGLRSGRVGSVCERRVDSTPIACRHLTLLTDEALRLTMEAHFVAANKIP